MLNKEKLIKKPFVINKDFNSIFCLSKEEYYLTMSKFKTISYVTILIILSWFASTSIVSGNPRDLLINVIMGCTSMFGALFIYFSIELIKMMKEYINDLNSRSTVSLVCRKLPEELLVQCTDMNESQLRRKKDKEKADRFLYKFLFGMSSTNIVFFLHMKRFISLGELEAFISKVNTVAEENGIKEEVKLTYIPKEKNMGYGLVTVE